jgi:DNA primase
MAGDTVQRVKEKLSIVEVVSQYLKLEKSGSTLRARCPFHNEKTPSFFVSPDRGTFHCFGCDKGGDVFTFVQEMESIDFKGALKILAEKAGVPLVFARGTSGEEKKTQERLFEAMEAAVIFYQSQLTDSARAYLLERGMRQETIAAFRVGYATHAWSALATHLKEKGFSSKEVLDAGLGRSTERGEVVDKFRDRIMLPLADSAGRPIAFSGRLFGEEAHSEAPKYLNSPETPLFHKSRVLFGIDKAKTAMRSLECAVLVEGQMDLLAAHQAGWANTVAVSGTAFTEEHARLIKRFTENIVLALDGDAAGVRAAARAARVALKEGLQVKIARLPEGVDPADLIKKEGPEAWKRVIREAVPLMVFLLDTLRKHTKDDEGFRRLTESTVFPFVADMQSPIEREASLRLIASRLGVSEGAVLAAFQKTAMPPSEENSLPENKRGMLPRARHAYALLLLQSSLPSPRIDVAASKERLAEILGSEVFAELESLGESEREVLRFHAESLPDRHAKEDFEALLDLLERDKLARELQEATSILRRAEAISDEAEITAGSKAVQALTAKIAQKAKTR